MISIENEFYQHFEGLGAFLLSKKDYNNYYARCLAGVVSGKNNYITVSELKEALYNRCNMNVLKAVKKNDTWFRYSGELNNDTRLFMVSFNKIIKKLTTENTKPFGNKTTYTINPQIRTATELATRQTFTAAMIRATKEMPVLAKENFFLDNARVWEDSTNHYIGGVSGEMITKRTGIKSPSVITSNNQQFTNIDDVERFSTVSYHRDEAHAASIAWHRNNNEDDKGFFYKNKIQNVKLRLKPDSKGNEMFSRRLTFDEINAITPLEKDKYKWFYHYEVQRKLSNAYVTTYKKILRRIVVSLKVGSPSYTANEFDVENNIEGNLSTTPHTKLRTKSQESKYIVHNTPETINHVMNAQSELYTTRRVAGKIKRAFSIPTIHSSYDENIVSSKFYDIKQKYKFNINKKICNMKYIDSLIENHNIDILKLC